MQSSLKNILGLVPGGARSVKPVPAALLALVPAPTDSNKTIKGSTPDVEKDTIPLIVNKASRTRWQVKKLAAALTGNSLADTLRNDSNFVLRYIGYQKDAAGHEEVRSPRRLVHEGKGDCDCYSVFLAAILLNQGIKFRFRLAAYPATANEWTHIYIVVPKDQSNTAPLTNRNDYYVVDPVTNAHDYEVKFSKKRDYTMALKFLDGIGTGNLAACSDAEKKPLILRLRRYVDAQQVVEAGQIPTRVFLRDNKIKFTEGYDTEKESGYFLVDTPAGKIAVSPIISKAEAQTLLPLAPHTQVPTRMQQIAVMDTARAAVTTAVAQVQQAAVPITENITAQAIELTDKAKKFNWLGWLLAAGGVYVLTREKKKAATLSGLPHKKKLTVARI